MEDQPAYNRRSIRLPHFDYTQPGGYFVTICTQDRQPLFGDIQNGEMRLSLQGRAVASFMEEIPLRFPNVKIETSIVMPNHAHLLFIIQGIDSGKAHEQAPTLGQIIGFFKYQTTKQINQTTATPGQRIWQRGYYEHIIRDERDYIAIWEYIQNNPLTWVSGEENLNP
ncbi:MAG TPA: transposase [Anaerolineaceae bacterium]|nr:transposase [Anaerolineaceae bacterium]